MQNLNKIDAKNKIIEIFEEQVKGRAPDTSNANHKHDGKVGHWLERQFGINHNANNEADLFGYELKTDTGAKITFGDWSANRYVFTDKKYSHIFGRGPKYEKQDKFLKIFGRPNPLKSNRYSWSGEPCPKISRFNDYGQRLIIDEKQDIIAIYDYRYDQRTNKESLIPKEFQNGIIEIARWFGRNSPSNSRTDKCIREKLEDKFNQNGWFTCKRELGVYKKICFGSPINFDTWIKWVETGEVYFDSGMYEGNNRPYSQWRMNNASWEKLITYTY